MKEDSLEQPRPPQFTLRSLFVLTAVVALVLGLAFPAIHAARESARRTACANNLRQIGLGLDNYDEVYQCLPPALWQRTQGQPHHSWRVAISPFIESSPFYARYSFGQPWDSPSNFSLGQQWLYPVYRCPAAYTPQGLTDYLAVTGATTAWPVPAARSLEDLCKGQSPPILLVERCNSGIHWMEPRDLVFDQLDFTIHSRSRMGFKTGAPGPNQAIASEHRCGASVLLADGSVTFLEADTSPEVLKEMLRVSEGP